MSPSEAIPLTVHIPLTPPPCPDDSNDSELTPSIEHFQSTISLPMTTNTSSSPSDTRRITFAPLPSVEPRSMRRSASQIKLGVSARSMLMQQRRVATRNRDDEKPDLPKGRHRGRDDGWGGTTNKVPPGNKEMWRDDEMSYPRTKTRTEVVTIGRLLKSAWSHVSQTPTRTHPSPALNVSTGRGSTVSGQTLDAPSNDLSEQEREMGLERRRVHSHGETIKAKQMPSIDENEAPLSNASIRLKFKKPMLVRSASEPSRKTTSVASAFRGR